MIAVEHLTKRFGRNLVLDDISETIREGEKVVVIGPSGSGKSTFLRCMNLLETPTSGTISFEGTVINDRKTDINAIRRQMGMVFQHFNLFPNMTIRKNITLAPVKTKLMSQEEADAEAEKLLDRVGLKDRADSYPIQLSGIFTYTASGHTLDNSFVGNINVDNILNFNAHLIQSLSLRNSSWETVKDKALRAVIL